MQVGRGFIGQPRGFVCLFGSGEELTWLGIV